MQPTPVFLPETFLDRGAWWAIVHRLAKRGTGLSMHSQRMYVESRQLVQKN